MKSYKKIKQMIENKTDELEKMVYFLQNNQDAISKDELSKQMMLCKEKKNEICNLVNEQKVIEIAVSSMPNALYSKLLNLRYIQGKTWTAIAEELSSSCESAHTTHNRALKQFYILKELQCKSMNTHIEVLTPHLWAVRFSYLEYIFETDCKSNVVPIQEESGVITKDGILILNEDNQNYQLLKEWFSKLMKRATKQLKRELVTKSKQHNTDMYQLLYIAMIQVELERKAKSIADSKRKGCGS